MDKDSETMPTESRKEPQVLLLDFGTLFCKGSVLTQGMQFNEYVATIRNQVYYISEEKATRLAEESKGTTIIPSGYFSRKEIEDKQLLFQADPVYVQLDAIPKDVEILLKAYQNICEQLESSLSLSDQIVNHYDEWSVVVAIAAFETQEAQKEVEKTHYQAAKQLGFKAIYINSQIMFDYISQIHFLKETGMREGYGFIINIGGGDTEVAAVSGVPMLQTFRRFPLAGQDVTLYCQNVLREQLRLTGVMINTIEDWLMKDGTVNYDAPSTIIDFKRRKLDIQPLLNAPAILFDYKKFYNKERRFNSITDIVKESIDAVIDTSTFDEALALILQQIIVVGGGAYYRGLTQRLELELKSIFHEFMNDIQVIAGEDPQNSGINGIRHLVRMKYGDKGLNYTILNK
ncbi:MAG: hypothetical protein ACXAC7_20650 [Candidatus Hodarchaeales archaeon]|jgi:actin-like ATPase involved in cell morphogenesis